MANPAPTINQINAFNATQGTTIDFNIIGGTELIRSNRIYIYDLSDNSLICTHLYVSTESIHELPPNTDGSIVYESGKSSADFANGAQYYAQIQTYTDTNGTQGGSGLSVAKMFWCLVNPTLTITTIPSTISTTSYNVSATYTDTSASVVSNIIQQYQFNLYSATGSLLQSSGVVVGSGTQQGTSDVYDISYNFTGLNVGSSYYVTVDVTTTQGMSVNAQSNTFTVSIDTPTLGEATVVNNACDGYISVTSNLSGEYGGSGSGEIVSFKTDSENVFSKLQVELEPVQEGSGTPSPSNVRPIRGHSEVTVYDSPTQNAEDGESYSVDFNATLTPTSTDTTPYLFKAVGDVYGDRLEDKIVGGTVAWNQYAPNFVTNNGYEFAKCTGAFSDGVATLTVNTDGATASRASIFNSNTTEVPAPIAFHKYFLTCCVKPSVAVDYVTTRFGNGNSVRKDGLTVNAWNLVEGVSTHSTPSGQYVQVDVYGSLSVGDTVQVKSFMVFDLTQMFGSTIADYIYSLEQSQAGAGVAWFKKLFPNDYYPYNAGELLSVEGLSAHVMRDADNNVIGNYPLDSSLTLRGIPKLDASNNLYYDGDEYTSDGKVKRKYGVVDLGSLNWTYYPSETAFYCTINVMNRKNGNLLCSKYTKSLQGVSYLNNMEFSYQSGADTTLWFKNTAYTDATAFKSAMSGVMLVYELATPTTETATPYTNPQIVSKYGTLEYVTNSIVPVGHKTTYLTRDIFGGYVDLISGKLVVDRVMVTLDGSADESFLYLSAYQGFRLALNDGKLDGIPEEQLLSNIFVGAPLRGAGSGQGYSLKTYTDTSDAAFVFICGTGHTTVSDFKDWLSNNNTQIVYPLATPQTYQLTPQQVNTLVGTNNVWSEQGNIELSYHIPITNLLVKRQDVDDVSGGWLTLYSQPISQSSDMDFTFIDFLNQYGKTYKYALVPLLTQTQSGVEVEVEGGYTVSNEVQSVFDGVFIADSTGSQKCKANVGYGNVDMNQVVGSITPIGAKYPIIVTNSHNQYHNGSISGTIVPDDYYFNGNLSRIDMVNKRNELEQFLTNKRVKVIKDWNGNIWLVMIAGNVSCTFNNNYGMGIVDFSTNWTEVGDPTNQQDLQATGLINVGGV